MDSFSSEPVHLDLARSLAAELRMEHAQDSMQLKSVLWHSWLSVTAVVERFGGTKASRSRQASGPQVATASSLPAAPSLPPRPATSVPVVQPPLSKEDKIRQRIASSNDRYDQDRQKKIACGFFTDEEYDGWYYLKCPHATCTDLRERFTQRCFEGHM